MRESHVIALRANLADIGRLAEDLETLGDRWHLTARLVSQLNLTLEEVVTNILSYGYDDDAEHVIRIDFELDDDLLTARVEDDGRAYDPLQVEVPDTTAALDDRRIGGLGIHLVRTLMDDVRYARVGDKNVLTLTKRTGA